MGKERREFDRTPLQVPMLYRRASELASLWQKGIMTDLSAGGMRFTTDELVELGTKLEFEVRLSIRQIPFTLRGFVASEQSLDATQTDYGVGFLDLDPNERVGVDELVQFLSQGHGPS